MCLLQQNRSFECLFLRRHNHANQLIKQTRKRLQKFTIKNKIWTAKNLRNVV